VILFDVLGYFINSALLVPSLSNTSTCYWPDNGQTSNKCLYILAKQPLVSLVRLTVIYSDTNVRSSEDLTNIYSVRRHRLYTIWWWLENDEHAQWWQYMQHLKSLGCLHYCVPFTVKKNMHILRIMQYSTWKEKQCVHLNCLIVQYNTYSSIIYGNKNGPSIQQQVLYVLYPNITLQCYTTPVLYRYVGLWMQCTIKLQD